MGHPLHASPTPTEPQPIPYPHGTRTLGYPLHNDYHGLTSALLQVSGGRPHLGHTSATLQPHFGHTSATLRPHLGHTSATLRPHLLQVSGEKHVWAVSHEDAPLLAPSLGPLYGAAVAGEGEVRSPTLNGALHPH